MGISTPKYSAMIALVLVVLYLPSLTLGNELPDGAIARLGSYRFWHPDTILSLLASPDGKMVATTINAKKPNPNIFIWNYPTGELLWKFKHPAWPVKLIAFSPDGTKLTSVVGQKLMVWNLQTGKEDRAIHVNLKSALAMRFLSNSIVAVAGSPGLVRYFDIRQGNQTKEWALWGNNDPNIPQKKSIGSKVFDVREMTISPNGKMVAMICTKKSPGKETKKGTSAAEDEIHNTRTTFVKQFDGKTLFQFEIRNEQKPFIAFSPDNKFFVADRSVYLTRTGKKHCDLVNVHFGTPPPPDNQPRIPNWVINSSLAMSFKGKTLTILQNKKFIQYDLLAGKITRKFDMPFFGQHQNLRTPEPLHTPIAYNKDGKLLVGSYQLVRILHPERIEEILPGPGHRNQVLSVKFSKDSKEVHSVSLMEKISWKTKTWKIDKTSPMLLKVVKDPANIHISWVNQLALQWDTQGDHVVRDLISGKIRTRLEGRIRDQGLADERQRGGKTGWISSDGRFVAVKDNRTDSGTWINLHDASSGKRLSRLQLKTSIKVKTILGNVRTIEEGFDTFEFPAFCKARNLFACAENDSRIAMVEILTGRVLNRIGKSPPDWRKRRTPPTLQIKFSPSGRYVASGPKEISLSHDALSLQVWEAATGLQVFQEKSLQDLKIEIDDFDLSVTIPLSALALSPDNRFLAYAFELDSEIKVVELASGTLCCKLPGHQAEVNSLSFSPNGKYLASGSADTTVLIWDLDHCLGKKNAEKLTPESVAKHWEVLKSREARKAYPSIWRMMHNPNKTLPFLSKKLNPIQGPTRKEVQKWIEDLGSDKFRTRITAFRKLDHLYDLVHPFLKKAAKDSPTLEMHQRLNRLLTKERKVTFTAEELRVIRAMQILERIGNKEARQILRRLATGHPQVRLTQEAKESLLRLGNLRN